MPVRVPEPLSVLDALEIGRSCTPGPGSNLRYLSLKSQAESRSACSNCGGVLPSSCCQFRESTALGYQAPRSVSYGLMHLRRESFSDPA